MVNQSVLLSQRRSLSSVSGVDSDSESGRGAADSESTPGLGPVPDLESEPESKSAHSPEKLPPRRRTRAH
jgi:hypothetical protein